MPIKSLFVPSYAIQGEDIPAHILWDSLEYKAIKIQLPEVIKLKEIYNVYKEMLDISDKEVIVKGVEMDGYLGMLFSTRKLHSYTVDVAIKFSFIDDEGKEIIKEQKMINLFRPELEVVKMPENIVIDFKRNYVTDRIKLKKKGRGTLIINFNTPIESELQKKRRTALKNFCERLKEI
jgi:hypothetical protein